MRYRIVEHINSNKDSFFEVFQGYRFLFFWTRWHVLHYWIDKTFVTTEFKSRIEAEKYIKHLIEKEKKDQLKRVIKSEVCAEY